MTFPFYGSVIMVLLMIFLATTASELSQNTDLQPNKQIYASIDHLTQWGAYTTIVMGYANKPLNYSECMCSFKDGESNGITVAASELLNPLKVTQYVSRVRRGLPPAFPKPLPVPPKKGFDVADMMRRVSAMGRRKPRLTSFLQMDEAIMSSEAHPTTLSQQVFGNGEDNNSINNIRVAEGLASLSRDELYPELVRLYAEQGVNIQEESDATFEDSDGTDVAFIELDTVEASAVDTFVPMDAMEWGFGATLGTFEEQGLSGSEYFDESTFDSDVSDATETEKTGYSGDDYMDIARELIYG